MTWQERIIKELDNAEPDLADIGLSESGSPPYVENAIRQLSKAIAPSVKLRPTPSFSARQLGGIVGHKFSYSKPFHDGMNLPAMFRTGSPEVTKLLGEWTNAVRDYFPLVRRTVRRCFAIACDAPQTESAEFFTGFASALKKGSVTATARLVGATDASEFHFVVIVLGPLLKQQFKSMKQFHEFCVQLWGQRAGDRKTTEKRCSRIGLSFDGGNERDSK